MDDFELKPERKKMSWKSLFWNFLTVLVLLVTAVLVFYFLSIFFNPNSSINLFPPPALPTLYITETPTKTIIPRMATWTPTATIQPSPSRTKAPTWTLLPQMITPSSIPGTPLMPTEPIPTTSSTPMPVSAKITYLSSKDFHPDKNCDWLGVAGKVLGNDGAPLTTKTWIQVGGTLDGQAVNLSTISGSAAVYGLSGFELLLGEHPSASTQKLWIQMFDNNTAQPLSDKVFFDTFENCTQNLVMVVFTKIH